MDLDYFGAYTEWFGIGPFYFRVLNRYANVLIRDTFCSSHAKNNVFFLDVKASTLV